MFMFNVCFASSISQQSGVRQQIRVNIDHQVWSPCSVPNAEPKCEGKTLAGDVEKQGCRNQGSLYKVSYKFNLQANSNPEPTGCLGLKPANRAKARSGGNPQGITSLYPYIPAYMHCIVSLFCSL